MYITEMQGICETFKMCSFDFNIEMFKDIKIFLIIILTEYLGLSVWVINYGIVDWRFNFKLKNKKHRIKYLQGQFMQIADNVFKPRSAFKLVCK